MSSQWVATLNSHWGTGMTGICERILLFIHGKYFSNFDQLLVSWVSVKPQQNLHTSASLQCRTSVSKPLLCSIIVTVVLRWSPPLDSMNSSQLQSQIQSLCINVDRWWHGQHLWPSYHLFSEYHRRVQWKKALSVLIDRGATITLWSLTQAPPYIDFCIAQFCEHHTAPDQLGVTTSIYSNLHWKEVGGHHVLYPNTWHQTRGFNRHLYLVPKLNMLLWSTAQHINTRVVKGPIERYLAGEAVLNSQSLPPYQQQLWEPPHDQSPPSPGCGNKSRGT